MNRPPIPRTHLVLVGGGHSHVQTLRRFMMKPALRDGLRVTMIAREVHTPYSGMLPGRVAGLYATDEMHIDLARLCEAAGVRLIVDQVVAMDAETRLLVARRQPALEYDVVSLNCGASPGFGGVALQAPVVPVKPIGQFLIAWEGILTALRRASANGEEHSIAVVGAGAGGVELMLAISKSLENTGQNLVSLHLVESLNEILPGHNPAVKLWCERRLRRARISILKGFQVLRVTDQGLVSTNGEQLQADYVLWTTGVSAPSFLLDSGLDLDSQGFVRVNKYLQSLSHENVFAAGDVAHLVGQARPKSGVYAVRSGPALTRNLLGFISGSRLKPYRAQKRALAIIGDSRGSAVASRDALFVAGKPVFSLKQYIDRRFMRKFEPIAMQDGSQAEQEMRCAGCGAKLPSSLLRSVLARLEVEQHREVLQGIGEDAAVLRLPAQQLAVTTDHFPQMVSDTYRFGRIAAHHALSDLFAMGAVPRYALVNLTLRLMSRRLMEEEMFLLLKGINEVLAEEGVSLIGGHTTEGEVTQLGCTVFGRVEDQVFEKSALAPGDVLVLTKPIGIGVLLAGNMRAETKGRWLCAAMDVMDQSNATAASVLHAQGVRACTDVTGFGLLGHLSEMLRASRCSAEVELGRVPILAGAQALMASGIESSLQLGNEAVMADVELLGVKQADPLLRLLMDPQTSGGLLVAVNAPAASSLIEGLHRAGYDQAAVIGRVVQRADVAHMIVSKDGIAS